MDKEKSDQIQIALLGVIALMLIIKTVNMPTGQVVYETVAPETAPITAPQSITNLGQGLTVNPAVQQSVPQIIPQAGSTTAGPTTSMTFDQVDRNLGSVSIGEKKTHTFKVTNTGSVPLTFNQLNADPGLTITSQPSAPIAPGDKGEITVEFAADASGAVTKTIHVSSNTEPAHMHLTVAADVK